MNYFILKTYDGYNKHELLIDDCNFDLIEKVFDRIRIGPGETLQLCETKINMDEIEFEEDIDLIDYKVIREK